MAKKKTSKPPKNDFAPVDDLEICSFSSEPVINGDCISSFSFDDDSNENISIDNNQTNESSPGAVNTANLNISYDNTKDNATTTASSNNKSISNDKNILAGNKKISIANGMAPPIDGEFLDVKRTYMLRSSTIRKLHELKSIHPELNIYVSTIVDMAIAHYYNHIINEGGNQ